jgi:hypothetical protein
MAANQTKTVGFRALEEKEQSSCIYGQVIDDAKLVLKGFIGWEVCHIKRELNMAAQASKGGFQQFF